MFDKSSRVYLCSFSQLEVIGRGIFFDVSLLFSGITKTQFAAFCRLWWEQSSESDVLDKLNSLGQQCMRQWHEAVGKDLVEKIHRANHIHHRHDRG